MKIIVTAKRVLDPSLKIKIKADGSGIDFKDMTYKLNPFDEIAIEEALKIKEKYGGEVVLLCIGPPEAQTEIRRGLSMGADRAVLVEYFGYAEPSVAARIFKPVIEEEAPDLVLMGKQSIDDDANQTGQMLACLLGWPQACFASQIDIIGEKILVKREVDGGIETLELQIPAVITADLRLNEPRYPTLPNIMKARKKKIEIKPVSAIGADITPRVNILYVKSPKERQGSCKFFDNVDNLVNALKHEAKIIG